MTDIQSIIAGADGADDAPGEKEELPEDELTALYAKIGLTQGPSNDESFHVSLFASAKKCATMGKNDFDAECLSGHEKALWEAWQSGNFSAQSPAGSIFYREQAANEELAQRYQGIKGNKARAEFRNQWFKEQAEAVVSSHIETEKVTKEEKTWAAC